MTDDTQMAVCIAEEAAKGTLDRVGIGERFLGWFRAGQKDVGIQTARVLSAADDGVGLPAQAAVYFAANPRNAAGNGSLMRTGPVALPHLGDDAAIVEAATRVSALTHGDPLAGEACALWSIGIDRAVRVGRLDGVRDGVALLAEDRRSFWSDRLDEAEASPPGRFNPNGFVVTTCKRRTRRSSRRPSLPISRAGICRTRWPPQSGWVTIPTLSPPSLALSSVPGGGLLRCPCRGRR